MNSTKLEPHHLDLPTKRYTFFEYVLKFVKRIKQNKNRKPNQLLLGRPGRTRRPAKHAPAYASTAQKRRGPSRLPPARVS